jgi:hypothetical protein
MPLLKRDRRVPRRTDRLKDLQQVHRIKSGMLRAGGDFTRDLGEARRRNVRSSKSGFVIGHLPRIDAGELDLAVLECGMPVLAHRRDPDRSNRNEDQMTRWRPV